jgi:hypothetical protein
MWDETVANIAVICGFGKAEYFFVGGWTGKSAWRPTGKSLRPPGENIAQV